MTEKPEYADQGMSRSKLVKGIRKEFGQTQAELALALGISTKAVQSYEQGWRKVPTRVLKQLLVLLAIFRRRTEEPAPCWETISCPPERRDQCPSYTIGDGQFCWFVAAKSCFPPQGRDGDEDFLPCMDCEVILRLLKQD